MSAQDSVSTRAPANRVQRELIAYYGSFRSAVGSILFLWLNVSLLLAFSWPVLVIIFEAPSVAVEDTPIDWFVLRLGIALFGLVVTLFLWHLSPVPMRVATLQAVADVFKRGVLWTQVLLILAGVSLVLAAMLIASDAGPATKLVIFGLVEAVAIQALFGGYVKSAFDVLFKSWQAFLSVVGLFALFFGLRSMAFAMTAIDGDENYMLALAAGSAFGVILGAVTLLFRDRSGSLLPGILLHWTVFYLLSPYLD